MKTKVASYLGLIPTVLSCCMAQSASITPLGFLPDRTWSAAYGVSDDGAVVVGGGGLEAFRWTAAGGMASLPFAGNAYGASADGSVVVGTGTIAEGVSSGYRWTQAEGASLLPEMSAALAVSDDGKVVAGHSPAGAQRWTQEAGTEELDPVHRERQWGQVHTVDK
jgi:uncharacterized membrane protein